MARKREKSPPAQRAGARTRGGDGDREVQLLFCAACAQYAVSGEVEDLETVAGIYPDLESRFSPVQREAIEKAFVEMVCEGTPALLLVPFVTFDSSPSVVSTAALDYAVLQEPDEKHGEFTGVRLMLELARPESGLAEANRAGILVGLALLGDRRLLPMLDGCWRLLGPQGRQLLGQATSGLIAAGLIEFFLGWLEQTEDESDFGGVVGTLCRMPSLAQGGRVFDIQRSFPAFSTEEPIRCLKHWTFPDYYEQVRRRLDRLAKQESEPKLIPQIALHWGGRPARSGQGSSRKQRPK